jgi:hypothetical protein
MALFGGEYIVTGTATSVASILGVTGDASKWRVKQIIFSPDPANADPIYWGRSNVTATTNRCGLVPTTVKLPVVVGSSGGTLDLDLRDIYIVGPATATLLISCIQ